VSDYSERDEPTMPGLSGARSRRLPHIPFVDSGAYPVRDGNQISPLVDGEPAFRRVCQAIETAQHSVWVTVTVMWPGFSMPDDYGSALDVLDRAAARGLDVRVLFWRPGQETPRYFRTAFWGSDEHLALLESRRSGIKVRWDRARVGYCQHQKSWLIDAGHDTSLAILGGINLNPHSVVAPGHHGQGDGQNHDVYIELTGPCVADVHHNFVQRWNEASERSLIGGMWGTGADEDLAFPAYTPRACGDATAQVQRTIPADLYRNGRLPSERSLSRLSGESARTSISTSRQSTRRVTRFTWRTSFSMYPPSSRRCTVPLPVASRPSCSCRRSLTRRCGRRCHQSALQSWRNAPSLAAMRTSPWPGLPARVKLGIATRFTCTPG
jgi:phosphatidylserine/phosphatidylglycerophosphate/cardiolipin synthase-like enzyme